MRREEDAESEDGDKYLEYKAVMRTGDRKVRKRRKGRRKKRERTGKQQNKGEH